LQRFAVSIGEKIAIARFALKKGEQAAQACANADYVSREKAQTKSAETVSII
jgi:hypothetical protein